MMVRADEEDVRSALAGRAPTVDESAGPRSRNGTLGQALATFLASTDAAGPWEVAALGTDGMRHHRRRRAVLRTLRRRRGRTWCSTPPPTPTSTAPRTSPTWRSAVNAVGPENLARVAAESWAQLVHYSTDFVFDGERRAALRRVRRRRRRRALYARSKLAGRDVCAAAAQSRDVFIVRVGCLYGRGGRNFPSTILRRLRAGETHARRTRAAGLADLGARVARVSAALARTEHFGLYHCTSDGETSWADYARFLAAELGLPDERVQRAAHGGSCPAMRRARPRRAVLDNRMLRLRGLDTMPDWQDAARAFIRAERR